MCWLIPSRRFFSIIYCQEAGVCDLIPGVGSSLFLLRITSATEVNLEEGSWSLTERRKEAEQRSSFPCPHSRAPPIICLLWQCSCPASLFNTTWLFQSFIFFPFDWQKWSNWKRELERKKISELLVSLSLIRYLAVGCSGCIEPVLPFTNLRTVTDLGYKT